MGFVDKIMGLWQGNQTPETVEAAPGTLPNLEASSSEESAATTPPETTGAVPAAPSATEAPTTQEAPTAEQQRIVELEQELQKRDHRAFVTQELEKAKIPLVMADYIDYTSEATVKKSTAKLQEVFIESVNAAVKERLRGRTPEGLGRTNAAQSYTDEFAKALRDPMNVYE